MNDVGRLLRVIGPERRWVALAAVAASLTLVAGVGLAAASANLISRAALVGSTTALALAITTVRLCAVVRAAGRYVERYVGHLGTFRILTRIRVWCFRQLEPLAPAGLVDRRRGDLLARVVGDVDSLQDFYLRVAVPPLAAVVTGVAATIGLGLLDPRLGAVLAAWLVLCGSLLPWVGHRGARVAAADVVRAAAERDALLTEAVRSRDELVVLGASDAVVERVEELDGVVRTAQRRLAVLRGADAAALALSTAVAVVLLLATAANLAAAGRIGRVAVAVPPLVALALVEAVGPLGTAAANLDRTRTAARRVFEVVDRPPPVVDPADPDPPPNASDLSLHDVDVDHGGGFDVLRGVDLEVPAGSRVAVVGGSGAGKSTLAATMVRFVEHRGSARLGGVELRRTRAADVRDRIALVAQHDHLFDTTVRDNLLLADPDAADDVLMGALDDAGLGDAVRSLPDGLDHRVGADGELLSGGERQRLLIARGLLREAPVLVLDEATAHLDGPTARKVLEAVHRRRSGRTTITISHDAHRLGDFDLVVRLDGGRAQVLAPDPSSRATSTWDSPDETTPSWGSPGEPRRLSEGT